MMSQKVYLITLSIIFLVGGLLVGYYYGYDKGFDASPDAGIEKGSADLLAVTPPGAYPVPPEEGYPSPPSVSVVDYMLGLVLLPFSVFFR